VSVPCVECDGYGYLDQSKPEIACTTCGGDGVVPEHRGELEEEQ
jgi:DnaJ-class molecular chaperone